MQTIIMKNLFPKISKGIDVLDKAKEVVKPTPNGSKKKKKRKRRSIIDMERWTVKKIGEINHFKIFHYATELDF